MNNSHTLYILDTGEITGEIYCDDSLLTANIATMLEESLGVIEYASEIDGTLYYYDLANSILVRPSITASINKTTILAGNTDTCIISGLPEPCTITVDETSYEVTDGSFEFTTDLPGAYTVTVTQFPYIPQSWEVTAE